MTQHLKALTVAAATLLITLSGCSSNENKTEQTSEQMTYEVAQKFLRTSNWASAAETLELLEESFPFGAYAEQAQLELIYSYYRSTEHDAAIASADRFIRLHPQHRNVDYAYYMRGISAFENNSAFNTVLSTDITKRDAGSARESFDYFTQLLERYPDSQYALDAQKRMIYLRNMLGRYEIHVANYYFKRGAYLAAANRGRYVVENLKQTPAVPDGLAVMAQAYHMLGMDDLSQKSAQVLIANYPNHPALKNGEFNYRFGRDKNLTWVNYLTLGLFKKQPTINFDTRNLYNSFYRDSDANPVSSPPG
ncbi:outer membrane protein assembly factor BamD [Teredinibacter purpureus]|uniref:outer membrane protein assembly factor BamD n=1 Tax=Teredinibacter purpureus TaxID=2731756 RepID=UPI0005F7BC4F|nr:outer membrane protein assembly factor BamD [Teredinibacter purpureus]